VYQKGYILAWIGLFIGLAILWSFLYGICFLPRWINNKLIHKNRESVFYITIKRCAIYALIIPIITFFSVIFPNTVGKLIGDLVESFGEIFEFISHLFNYIELPKVINGVLVFILAAAFIFLIIHLISSVINLLYKRIRSE
jgi:hypothetical protein